MNEVFAWFNNFTSLGGYTQYLASKNPTSKIFWAILTVLGLFITIISMERNFTDLLGFGVTTSVTVSGNSSLNFPTVTLCNSNRVNCLQLFRKIEICKEDNECGKQKEENLCKLSVLADCSLSIYLRDNMFYGTLQHNMTLCNEFEDNLKPIKEIRDTKSSDGIYNAFYEIYLSFTRDELKFLAHQPEKMIKECSFDNREHSQPCKNLMNSTEADIVFSPRHGICYVFNFATPKTLYDDIMKTYSAGQDMGLTLVINLETDAYMRYGLAPTEGLGVSLAEPYLLPEKIPSLYWIAPGTETNMALKAMHFTRQPPVDMLFYMQPYATNCTSFYPPSQAFLQSQGMKYSQSECKKSCLVHYVIEKCGCHDPLLMDASIETDYQNKTFCPILRSDSKRKCASEATANFGKDDSVDCNCQSECDSLKYEVSVSTATWPSQSYWAMIADEYKLLYHNSTITYEKARDMLMEDNATTEFEMLGEFVQSNFLKLNIYFGSMSVMSVSESPDFTAFTFLSTLGGSMSLYLGITFISAFELLELLVRMMASMLKPKSKKVI